ncbi:PREDICTED: E3 ubiquitin-protein ligase TRIM71-like [Amphimedon queenslandica]|uniref:SMP-30/Gluconolactonase/LRE-like region domain-containing protein n=1 Tax=Amphimedon queenslandica TaxID=400682 RepID=A0AAN0IKD5_AMPQE|nr:PREDICTED: E3 ubiquitin-protein ligase TRIM71-like [Amphimedon queenslandica]|eukprot:XP_011402751.1 PREDICTED: E3 ubiquitin-protein ligase TRIM71-like [Amphimedon queenslandica]
MSLSLLEDVENYVEQSLKTGRPQQVLESKKQMMERMSEVTAGINNIELQPKEEADFILIAVTDDDHIIVTECDGHCVTILDREGKIVKALGREGGSGKVKFSFPCGVAITPDNFILVSDGNHKIQKISMDGCLIASVGGEEGSEPLQFCDPYGIAISPITGQVYIADKFNHRSANGQFLFPRDIAIDSQGLVYVTDRENHRIQKFSPDGTFVAQFGTEGSGPGQFYGITIDTASTDSLFFTSDGVFVKKFGSEGNNIDQFNDPCSLAFDKDGFLYVCDFSNNRLVVY